MNIFLSFLQSEKLYPIPAYNFWQHYIKNGIEEARYTWDEHPTADWALGLVPATIERQELWRRETWGKTVQYLKHNRPDLFLSYLYPQQIDTDAITEIQNMGIPCVNFFCDHVRLFTKIPDEFSVFDLNWVPEFQALRHYQKKGYPYIHLPMPMWVNPSYRIFRPEKNADVTFIGSKDIQRLRFLEDIFKLNPTLPLAIYGKGWVEDSFEKPRLRRADSFNEKLSHQYNFIKNNGIVPYLRKLQQRSVGTEVSTDLKTRVHGSIGFDIYNHLTSESMITLGINRYPSFRYPLGQPDTYSRLRDIEAPMLGACYLTEETEGIAALYEVGMEIEIYKDLEEFNEKAQSLLMDPKKRKSLKVNGQKRALQEHTISRSIHKIVQRLGL